MVARMFVFTFFKNIKLFVVMFTSDICIHEESDNMGDKIVKGDKRGKKPDVKASALCPLPPTYPPSTPPHPHPPSYTKCQMGSPTIKVMVHSTSSTTLTVIIGIFPHFNDQR